MANHVVLVGLMGSGKTTVGKRLAARLDRHFVDADAALEDIADRTIAEIFEQDGEAAFRDLEADTFEELLEHHEPCIIASGGGLVLRRGRRGSGIGGTGGDPGGGNRQQRGSGELLVSHLSPQ